MVNKNISKIGFGGWQLANPLWSKMTYEEGIALVRLAYEKGITFFDTAPGYANGKSEEIIGTALEDYREEIYINTKIGHLADGTSNFSVSSLESQIKMSLSRLKTDYIDSVLLHNPSFDILSGKTEHFNVLKSLKDSGLIHGYGASIDTYEEFEALLKYTDSDTVEILFNIFFQAPRYLFDLAKAKGVKIIVKVPLDSGWLTGKYDAYSKFTGIRSRWTHEMIIRRDQLVKKIKKIVGSDDLVLFALSYILSFDAVTTVIPGVKNETQLESNLKVLDYKLDEHIINQLNELYEKDIKNNPLPW